MIIRSLRLKNIKSYGEGPDGNGITIAFQPGINRVAGRNGHGKTTLIEALGYALFFSEPVFAERFALPTYFLRAGEKEGEIDVDFEHNGVNFRIERGLGQSRRKSKVIQLDDASTCAEGDEPVAAYLCRLLASEKHRLNTPRQLCDLFSNLIGVRQGHLSRPFDSKPKDAKEFFDPLLDVEIFRESTSRLNEAQGRFKDLMDEQSNTLSTLQERIREREDTLEKLPVKEAQVETLTKIAEKSRKQKKEADLQKAICERKETEFNAARTALDKANHLRSLATQKREQDQQNLKDSQEAADRLKKTEPGYQAYLQAESSLRLLQQQQSERSSLLRNRADALNSQTAAEGKMKATRQQLKDCKSRHDDKTKLAILLREQLTTETARLEATQREFEVRTESHAAAKRARDAFEAWLATLPAQLDQNKQLLAAIEADARIVAHWNPESVLKSRTEADLVEQAAQELGRKVAKAEEAKANLTSQLAQISGGMCPFLKEKCRQFNPQAIESDISEQEKAIVALASQHQQAVAASSQARKAWEKLAQQDSEIAHLKKSLEEKVRAWIERHNQLFPSSAQQNWSVLHSFAPHELPELETLPEISFETQWLSFQSNFDPAKLRKLAAVQSAFSTKIAAFHNVAARLDARFNEFQKQHEDRLRQERDCQHHKKNLQAADEELKSLAQKIDQFTSEAEEAGSLVKASVAKVAEFDDKLQAFASLDQQFALQNQIKDRSGQDHKDYLGCRSLAEKLEERSELLKKSSEAETSHLEEVRLKQQSFEGAQGAFDATALESARNDAAAATTKLAIDERATQIAERELREEKERFKQWKQAFSERDKINDEMARLRAAGQVARLAGKVLKDAAPAVAQHLCSRIAIGAQRIFNQINPEPIELEWKAEPNYSLRVTPGDRRFAMLSGGEQTKLALAMTLAMIEQFSGLRFAVFDEPTYGVDAESRDKLAEAVIDLQKAAGLNQLILVSHDNAFEGKIENVITLQKSAFLGTELVSVA